MWNICNYGCIVCMSEFRMYNFFLIRTNLLVTGPINVLVIGNEYTNDSLSLVILPVTGSLPVTSNLLPVTVYQ
jgi:hypothetical protein